MPLTLTRPAKLAATVLAVGAMVVATAASANAGGGGVQPTAHAGDLGTVITTSVTTDGGFTMPDHIKAGFVTFTISSPEADFHAIQGFSVKQGHTLAEVIQDFTDGLSGDFPTQAQGATRLNQDADLIGGVVTGPFAPISATVLLDAGTYYFFDLNDLFIPRTPIVHTMKVTGQANETGLPHFDSVIVTTMEGGDSPIFLSPDSFGAQSSILVVNPGDEIHEAVFRQAQPGTTDDYITTFYNAVLAGGDRPPSPWLDSQHGLQAISPGRWAVLHIDLPPGTFALICYVPSDENGIPHGYMGMHHVVTLS